MQNLGDKTFYSATDLVRFAQCKHHIVLDLQDLKTPLTRAKDAEQLDLLAKKGDAHEKAYLEQLKAKGLTVIEVDKNKGVQEALRQTRAALAAGPDVIFQAALQLGPFVGYADFLRRVSVNGRKPAYEVADTKLARSAKGKFLIQLGLYSDMLADATGHHPEQMHVILGDGSEASFRVADYRYYLRGLREDFLAFATGPKETYPQPCAYCDQCQWTDLCSDRREKDDHLSLVAGVRASQTGKLEAAGIKTVAALAVVSDSGKIARLAPETLLKLRRQARMQVNGRKQGKLLYELIQDVPASRGFARLPPPSAGDVYFDFEGDPLHEDGLEYLFGVGYVDKGKYTFWPIWAHSRQEERKAFIEFMDWLTARIKKHPGLHVYHYGHYEPTALKRLMTMHGTHESQLDQLLRGERFVDLYRVVREGLVTSEPAYSLKNIEKFFMPAREGDVADAGASIVYYENWRETQDPALLETIRRYNEFDVEATRELVAWLRRISVGLPEAPPDDREVEGLPEPSENTIEVERTLRQLWTGLIERLPEQADAPTRAYRKLVYSLMDFHRRAEKPGWWAMYARCDAEFEELQEDLECIAGCKRLKRDDPDARAIEAPAVFRYPEQDFKLRVGDDVMDASTAERAGAIVAIDEDRRLVGIRPRARGPALPDEISFGAGGPMNTKPLRDAMFRYGASVAIGDKHFPALRDLLRRSPPRIKGRKAGDPVLAKGKDLLPAALDALANLDDSTLFIQGPPGCGKTYSASWLIVELMRKGKRVGVSSNSHKAIHNLLEAVEERARESGFEFEGVKRSNSNEDSEYEGQFIQSVSDKRFLRDRKVQLLAGTAWLFADPDATGQLDYLFIDEAGQVSLANVAAMGMAARNIILVGDQMQLGQPIQGVHPGHSGESSLEYLLQGRATVPPTEGILLETTWRMHPDVCKFISDAVYDGRVHAHRDNARQGLVLAADADKRLKSTGLVYVPIHHDGCRQRSDEEAAEIKKLYKSLLAQHYTDQKGKKHRMTHDDILVVAPYNLQVDLLKRVLPAGARVGTVDKFQGQEAQAVIVSMTTSNGDCMPRHMDFLFSRNRLNVATSRARCLSIVVACPDLLHISCSTPEQMALVNVLAWFAAEAQGASA